MNIRALTIHQPYAGLIMSGVKDVENRSWFVDPLPDRLIIHASRKRVRPPDDVERVDMDDVYSAMLGTVALERIMVRASSRWAVTGHWHWVLYDPRPFTRPIHTRGYQGLWTPSDPDVLAALEAESVRFSE